MEAAAFGVMARRRRPPDHRLPRKAGRSARHARQARRRAGQHGHLRLRRRLPLPSCSRRTAPTPTPSHDFGKDIIPRVGGARAARWRIRSACPASRAPPRRRRRPTGATWARLMHSGRPTSTWPRSPPSSTSTTRDWPIWTYQRQLPPAKFVLDRDGKHGMTVNTIVSGGCIVSGSHGAATRCCSRACACIRSATSTRRCCCPTWRSAAAAGCSKVVIDRGCVHPRRAW